MCALSVPVQREVVAQILWRVARREMFTAWDIRQSVAEWAEINAIGEPVPHFVVRQMVHTLFFHDAMGPGYVRTAAPVGTRGETAYVYHHLSDAPGLYIAAQSAGRMLAL